MSKPVPYNIIIVILTIILFIGCSKEADVLQSTAGIASLNPDVEVSDSRCKELLNFKELIAGNGESSLRDSTDIDFEQALKDIQDYINAV